VGAASTQTETALSVSSRPVLVLSLSCPVLSVPSPVLSMSMAVSVSLGGVADAHGAALFAKGQTTVRALVYGPAQPRYSRHENPERCSLELELDFLSGPTDDTTIQAMRLQLQRALSQCISLESFPRMLITMKVLVSRDEGSAFATALQACTLALLDAGLPMHTYACAVSLAVLGNQLVVDPSQDEESAADSLIHCIYNASTLNTPLDAQLLVCEVTGSCNVARIAQAQSKALEAALVLRDSIRTTISKKISTQNI
jgi:exosome complex component RRP46